MHHAHALDDAAQHALDGIGQCVLFGLGSVWWVADQLVRHGPSWSVVPPTLIACASLVTAIDKFISNRRAERKRG